MKRTAAIGLMLLVAGLAWSVVVGWDLRTSLAAYLVSNNIGAVVPNISITVSRTSDGTTMLEHLAGSSTNYIDPILKSSLPWSATKLIPSVLSSTFWIP